MIVTRLRRFAQFERGFLLRPNDQNIAGLAIRLCSEKIRLAELAGEVNATERFSAGKQPACRGHRQKCRAGSEIRVQYPELHFAFAVMREHEIEDRPGALMKRERVCLGNALALEPQILFAEFF
jgi:hypothetical protein